MGGWVQVGVERVLGGVGNLRVGGLLGKVYVRVEGAVVVIWGTEARKDELP